MKTACSDSNVNHRDNDYDRVATMNKHRHRTTGLTTMMLMRFRAIASQTKQTDKMKDSIIQAADVLSSSSRTHSSDKQSLEDAERNDVMHRTTLNHKNDDDLVHVRTVPLRPYSLAINDDDNDNDGDDDDQDRTVVREGVSSDTEKQSDNLNDQSSLSSSKVSTVQTIINGNQANSQSVVTKQSIERASLPSFSQLMPTDLIINDKQVTKAIFNSTSADEQRRSLTMLKTKTDSHSDNSSSYRLLYPLVTASTSNLSHSLLLSNQWHMAHARTISTEITTMTTTVEPLLTETSFIILITMLTILILLFCLALFCICRRHPRRQISPSFDGGGGNYHRYNEHSLEIPIGLSHDQKTFLPFKEMAKITSSEQKDNHLYSPSHSSPWTNENLQSTSLHQTKRDQMKLKMPKNKKLKKKRLGLCCCSNQSQSSRTNTINGRTRMR